MIEVEERFILNKDNEDSNKCIKKKSRLTLKLVLFVLSSVNAIYICSTNLEQPMVLIRATTRLLELRVTDDHSCHPSHLEDFEHPYVHYPHPTTFNREECGCNPVRYFCIISMQRSGSGWLEALLNSHINITSNGEIFSKHKRRGSVSSILKTMDKVYNLDYFTSASKNECNAAVGFKWMLNQGLMAHHEEIVEYFQRKGVSVIFLLRRNFLRRIVSLLANSYDKYAKQLNGTHKSHVPSTTEAGVLAKYKPLIKTTSLMAELKQTEETVAKAIEYFNNTRHIVLYYEDLLKNRTKLNDVQEFLRLPYRDLQSVQVKIHTKPLSKQIENWEEVKDTLKGTPYQSFLFSN